MARRRSKWIRMKSRKNGKKTTKLVNQNNEILNKLSKN
jgi:hypothetical protein